MIQQTITLPLGGQERTLLYGVMGYFEYIKVATGQDPFDFLTKFETELKSNNGQMTVMKEDTSVIVYAGLNSYLDSMDGDNISIDKVKKWCNALNYDVVAKIWQAAYGSLKVEQPGELQPQGGQENGSQKISA